MDQNELEDENKPLDPAVERVRRKLVRFMAINLGLLFVALMAVVLAIVYRWTRDPEPAQDAVALGSAEIPGEAVRRQVPLEPGTRVHSQALSGDRVSLHVETAGGARQLVIYDFAQGRIIAQLDLPNF
ncbi:fimbrial protein [Tianweitania sediminis]|uniref:Fimbrial protein n=1 Tax=Tianweitania sediminis TaxID=1502156 RepID=A0A8J7RGQ3_9HYPH|nr:fimbrial protein [Tianweitania sediminis]